MNEKTMRERFIDPALLRAGWDVQKSAQVGLEIPVDGTDPIKWAALSKKLSALKGNLPDDAVLPSGIADYVLYRDNGEILAVVEAKKARIDPRLAQAQAEYYIEEIAKRQEIGRAHV